MRRRWAFGLGTAVLSAWLGSAHAGDPEPIAYLPRALPAQRLTPPVPGIAKESALHPPVNDMPLPATTPPAFTPGSPSLCSLCEPRCDGGGYGCGSCCNGDKQYYAGVGFYFMQPFWSSNPAFFAYNTTGGVVTAGAQQDFRHDYELSPLAWFGCKTCDGFGARARWWKYDQGASESFTDAANSTIIDSATPLGLRVSTTQDNAPSAEVLAIDSDLVITVVDLELTQDLQAGCWWLTFAAGGRYAHVAQNYDVIRLNATATVLDTLISSHNFNGAGVTAAVEGHRPLGCLGLACYGSARGSILFGGMEQTAALRGTATRDAVYAHESLLPITELEFGLEWRGEVGCCELFLQAAVINQAWFGAGNPSRTIAPGSANTPFRSAPLDDATLGFFGGTVTAGIRF